MIAYGGRETLGGRTLDHLVVTPRGGKRFDAWFDADTHLLVKVAQDEQFLHVIETYDDDRTESGLVLPHRIVRDPGLGPTATATLTLTGVSFGPAKPLQPTRHTGAFPPGFTDLVPELNPQSSDIFVTKQTWGAFATTDLERLGETGTAGDILTLLKGRA